MKTKKEMIKELVRQYVRQFEYGTNEWASAFCKHDYYENKIDRTYTKQGIEYWFNYYQTNGDINYVIRKLHML